MDFYFCFNDFFKIVLLDVQEVEGHFETDAMKMAS